MTPNSPDSQHRPALPGLVKCERCGLPMTGLLEPEPRYVCPNRLRGGPDDCPTPPTQARRLDEQAVRALAGHLVSSPGFDRVVNRVREEADRVRAAEKTGTERAVEGLKRQNQERLELLEKVEMREATYSQASPQVEELNELRSDLHSQVRRGNQESERQDFISDERRLRDAAQSIETYLDTTEPEEARRLFHAFIKDVLVRPGSATIRYTVPMPPMAPGGGVAEDVISLEPPAPLE